MARNKKEWVCRRTNKTFNDIDSGLDDTWLESLNNFQHLSLRSVCEGHPEGERWTATKSMPILRLSVESSLNARLLHENPPTEHQIETLFSASPLFSTSEIVHGWSDLGPKEYFLHLDAKQNRVSEEMEDWVRKWFEDSIDFLKLVDAYLATLALKNV